MGQFARPHAGSLAVITGASSGVGFSLAKLCARDMRAEGAGKILVTGSIAGLGILAEMHRGMAEPGSGREK